MEVFNMEVINKFDSVNGWNVLKFYDSGEEVGFMNVDLSMVNVNGNAFIFTISSYKKGYGTKMINYLNHALCVDSIAGDADPDSIGFWEKFNPEWNEESFEITL